MHRVILDTSVIVAAMRSLHGASARLVESLDDGLFVAVVDMSVVEVELPETYLKRARELARARGQSLEHVLSDAVQRTLDAEDGLAYLARRAERGKHVDVKAILAKAPDVPPMPGDELPQGWEK